MTVATIELKGVRKKFGSLEIIHGIDLTLKNGLFSVFVGPSGCGKSTLLRMMAGLEEVTEGEIHIDGVRCDYKLPSSRGMAMVFQSYALYPHMSVKQNLEFGLENIKTPKDEIRRRVAAAADILQIEELLDRRPNQLSGGQSQRVAIGRAIVKEPQAFLLDEPLSNLDAELRVKMRAEIVSLHKRLGTTMVYVTHDQVEAMTMADEIVVMRDGRIEQVGPPVELYARPINLFVAGFLGMPQMNIFSCQLKRNTSNEIDVILADGLRIKLSGRGGDASLEGGCSIGIRPEHLVISDDGQLNATVLTTEILGAETIVHAVYSGGEPITVSVRGISPLKHSDNIRLKLRDEFAHLFNEDGVTLQPDRNWQDDYLSNPDI